MARHRTVPAAHDGRRLGGVRCSGTLFGWLTAAGLSVVLTALVAGAGIAVGTDGAGAGSTAPATIGPGGGLALLVVHLVAYGVGGYGAGRMARAGGAVHGVAVWLCALAVATVVASAGAVFGARFDVLTRLNGFPRIPGAGEPTALGLAVLGATAAAALLGAVIGGRAAKGHRRGAGEPGPGR